MSNNMSTMKKNLLWKIIGGVVLIFCCAPMLLPGLPYGSDDTFHLGRFYSLGMAIRNGIFPAQIRPILCYRYGYGEGFFYSDFFLYLPALLIAFGVSVTLAVKIYMISVFLMIMTFMYYTVKRLTGSQEVAILCGCLYLLSNRVFGQYYIEFSLGCVTAAAFVPLAIGGMYLILKRSTGWKMFLAGCLGCVGSHVITTVLVAVICLLMLVFHGKLVLSKRKNFFRFLGCLVFMAMITAAYWLPMLEQFKTSRLKNNIHWAVEEDWVVPLSYLMGNRGIGIGLVLSLFLVLAFGVSSIFRRKKISDASILFGGIGLLYILLPSCYIFWHLINQKITLIQFPSRLYQPAAVLILFSLSFFLVDQETDDTQEIHNVKKTNSLWKNEKIRNSVLTIICVCLIIVSAISDIYLFFIKSGTYFSNDMVDLVQSGTIACAGSGQEWMPLEVDTDTLKSPETAIGASGRKVHGRKTRGDSVFTFEADANESWYDVPFIHYQGYRAVDEKGIEYVTTGDPENGLLRIEMPEKYMEESAGTVNITVYYHCTKWQVAGYMLSLMSFVIFLLYEFHSFRREPIEPN